MISPTLERFYAKIRRHILLIQSYTEIDKLAFIIKACRLKPYDYIFENNRELILHRHWIDEFGNSFNIAEKEIEITYNDLKLNREKIVCTDVYNGLSLNKIAKMSKSIYICAGKDEDLYQDCFFLTFLGIDNYIRSYINLYGEWQQVSSLLLGMKNLKKIADYEGYKYFKEYKNKKNIPIPCAELKEWLTLLPLDTNFLIMLRKSYGETFSFLNTKGQL